jgi:hypothetical protein
MTPPAIEPRVRRLAIFIGWGEPTEVQTRAIFSVYDPGVIRRIRLVTGLVTFAYVTTHFVNHALGLVSVQVRFWLSLKPWYDRWQPVLYAFALLMPTLAILGVFEGARQVRTPPAAGS